MTQLQIPQTLADMLLECRELNLHRLAVWFYKFAEFIPVAMLFTIPIRFVAGIL